MVGRPFRLRWIVDNSAATAITGDLEARQCVGTVEAQLGGIAAAVAYCQNAFGKTVMSRTVIGRLRGRFDRSPLKSRFR
jgi:hypothetical protein